MEKRGQRNMTGYKKAKCPRCKRALRFVHIRNAYEAIKLGLYCPECNRIKLKPGIKLIRQDIYIGLVKHKF